MLFSHSSVVPEGKIFIFLKILSWFSFWTKMSIPFFRLLLCLSDTWPCEIVLNPHSSSFLQISLSVPDFILGRFPDFLLKGSLNDLSCRDFGILEINLEKNFHGWFRLYLDFLCFLKTSSTAFTGLSCQITLCDSRDGMSTTRHKTPRVLHVMLHCGTRRDGY